MQQKNMTLLALYTLEAPKACVGPWFVPVLRFGLKQFTPDFRL